MDLIDAIRSWRSVRSFRTDPVDRTEVADLLWNAVQVSTPPQNETPWEICVLEGVDRIELLGERAMAFAREHRQPGQQGWNWVDRPGFKIFWGAPVVVIIAAQADNREAQFDCHRASQNLVLAAHVRGLGSCWLGSPLPWLNSIGVAGELGFSPEFQPTVVVALGHPATRPEPKVRPRPNILWPLDK